MTTTTQRRVPEGGSVRPHHRSSLRVRSKRKRLRHQAREAQDEAEDRDEAEEREAAQDEAEDREAQDEAKGKEAQDEAKGKAEDGAARVRSDLHNSILGKERDRGIDMIAVSRITYCRSSCSKRETSCR